MRRLSFIMTMVVLTAFFAISFKAEAREMNNILNSKQKSIIEISAYSAKGDLPKLEEALNVGLDSGLTVNETKEILVQLYAYAGFPRSLNALGTFKKVLDEREAKGIKDVDGKTASDVEIDTTASKDDFGHKVRSEITNTPLDAEPYWFAKFAPAIDDFLKQHLFADIFARDVLTHKQRELATVSMLAAIDGAEPQLGAHLNIALNVGVTKDELKFFTLEIKDILGDKVYKTVTNILSKVLNEEIDKKGEKEMDIKIVKSGTNEDVKGNPENFSGDVTIRNFFKGEGESRLAGATVIFEAGARTAWHDHEIGQMLLVTSGKGLIQKEGGPIEEIAEGDVVWIPAHIKHWHGATPDTAMTHVAIVEDLNGKNSTWMELVTEEQYKGE